MFHPDPTLVTLLQATVAAGASDLHVTVGRPATARRDGVLVPFEGVEVFSAEATYCSACLAQQPKPPAVARTACRDGALHGFSVRGDALLAVERAIQAGTLDACADMIQSRVDAGEHLTLGYVVGLLHGLAERKRAP